MIQEIRKPDSRTFYKFTSTDGLTVHEGYTDINQVTQSGLANKEVSIDASTIYPALPSSGRIEEGVIYSYQGGMVRVVQSHDRTLFKPEETPNLFDVVRPNTEGMAWVANEKIEIGDKRDHDGITYRAIQGFTTRVGQTPDKTPALWGKFTEPNVIAEWKQPAGAHDAYRLKTVVLYKDAKWECTSDYCVYAPGVYGWKKL